MNCPACAHENRAGARFCEECAAPLKRACASCGVELRPTAKFCDECGAPAGGARSEPKAGEAQRAAIARPTDATDTRKVVTIVFADLVGSTALHERLEPESARRFMEAYYIAMRGAVESHGGTVTQLLGDGVKAVFGIPRVAEDDAIRAVRAAIAMQEAFRALADAQRGAVGKTGLRVAVNTGEVVANDATEIIGDPVNVAARLQEQGQDGDVVVGESTHRLVSTLVTLELLGSFALKGRSEAVKAYRVVSLDRPAGAATAPFVGRAEEIARLTAVYDTAVEKPAAGLAVLVGSPGLGKSRLIDEFARRSGDSATVVRAHCDAAGGATFAPLAQAFRELLGIEDGASAEVLRATIEAALAVEDADRARVASGITALLAGSPASPEETFFVVRRLLGALAHAKPVVLVIDDLHWAEPLLLDLVEHLIQWGGGVPLFVLIGARPELRDLRSSLVTPGGLVADVVTLSGLDAGAAMRLAANVIGASDLPAAIAAKVLATSEGNPLFVGELVRMLVQEGAITREGDRWIAGANLAALEMPPTIHALLAARIERLRPEERVVLERAAVVGRHFSRSAVAALMPREAGDLDARLEALRRSELIERDTGWLLGEPVLRFHHVLIRDAAYRRLLKGTRAELHAKLADWIEAQAGDAPEHDDTIGWHLEQAHQFLRELAPLDANGRRLGERAATRLAAAGRRALARDDLAVAADLLGRAIDRLDSDDPARADLALDWCEALLAAGDVGPAAAAIVELERFAAESERVRAWHTCFVGQHTVLTAPSALHATTGAVAAAADALTAQGDAAGEAKAHYVHALALSRLGKVGDCEAALDRALAAARRAGDRRRANTVLAIAPLAALWGPSPVTRASGRCLDVVRVLRITQGAPAVEAVALSCQGVLEALRGRTEAARRMIASARKMVEELGITQRLLEADVSAGLVALLEGDASAAERSLRGAYDGLRDLGLGIDAARAAALLARALLAQGRADEAEALSHESEALAGDDLKAAIAWRGARAEALARRGEHVEAVALATRAVEMAAATDALLDHADARLALAAALRAAGRRHDADAEERRAKELWQAKGATLLAERAAPAEVPVAPPLSAAAPPAAPTARRRQVRPNFAFEEMRRAEAAVAARDARALETLYRRDVEVVDHQFGITYGYAEIVERVRAIIEDSTESAFAHEPLASLGDSLALCRMRSTASGSTIHGVSIGATEIPYLLLLEADEQGSARRIEIFGDDKLGDAVVRLYERYAEQLPEGVGRTRAQATTRTVAVVAPGGFHRDGRFDLDSYAAVFRPDAEVVDHKLVSGGAARGTQAQFRLMAATTEIGEQVTSRCWDVLALSPDALLLRWLVSGVARESGGAFEWGFLRLFVLDPDGRVARYELFEDDREAEALARFEALTAPPATPPSARRVRANAATAVAARVDAAFAARDLDAFAAQLAPSLEFVDHPVGASYGHADAMAGVRAQLRAHEPRWRQEPVATLGSRLGLFRRSVSARATMGTRFDVGASETVDLLVCETDAAGATVQRIEVFAADRLGDAVVRLYERWAAQLPEGAGRAGGEAVARAVAAMSAPTDPDRLAATYAPDLKVVDHRLFGTWSARSATELVAHWRAQLALSPDNTARFDEVLALDANQLARRTTYLGTGRESGGSFENHVLELFVFAADGRLARVEVFEPDQRAEVLARFDALAGDAAPMPPVRRRLQANAASASFARFEAAFAARDAAAWEAEFDASLAVIAHPTGASYGLDGHLRSLLRLARSHDPVLHFEPIATLGEHLALARRRVAASGATSARYDVGAYEREELVLSEAGSSGRAIAIEIFASDRLGDAVVRLYERYAERLPDGPERVRAEATARSLAAPLKGIREDPGTHLGPVLTPDFVGLDHRHLSTWSLRGASAYLEHLRALRQVADEIEFRQVDVLALTPNAQLMRVLHTGTDRASGGVYERPFLSLFAADAEGRLARAEWFDADREAEALARFEALVAGPAAPARRVRANAAARSVARFVAALEARDADALPAFFDDALRVVHHPSGSTYGRREMLATWRSALRAERIEFRRETLATLGDGLVLSRQVTAVAGLRESHLADFGATEVHELSLVETNADGRWTHVELFAPDRLGDAVVRLYERHAAQQSEDAGRARATALARAALAVMGPIDLDRMASVFTPELRSTDRRVLATWSAETGAELVAHFRHHLELAPDFAPRVEDVLLLEAEALIARITYVGTAHDSGGAFENRTCVLFLFGDDGRIAQIETFEAEQVAEALACFDALDRGDAAAEVEHPFANAASRANRRRADAFNARDWAGIEALAAPGLVFDERRRLLRNVANRDVWLAQTRLLFDLPERRFEIDLVATRGERLALHVHRFEGVVPDGGGPLAMDDHLALYEVDDAGRIEAIVLFDLEDANAAHAELDARFEAGEAAASPHALASHVATNAAMHGRDWGAVSAQCAPTFQMRDHRLLGWGMMVNDADTFVRVVRSAVELAPDSSYRHDHVRICPRGTLAGIVLCGTRDGGAFETPLLRVTEVDAQGRILSHDTYDESDFDRALARFAELAAPEAAGLGRFENAASRAWRAVNAAWSARDLGRFEGLHAAFQRYRDHRRLFQLDLDREGFLDFTRPLLAMRAGDASLDLAATRGERLALMHSVMRMEDEAVGPSTIESLMMIETDERGAITAYDRWDLGDLDAAHAELDARFADDSGAASGGAVAGFSRAIAARDWDAVVSFCAPGFVEHDHRSLKTLGTTRGAEAWMENFRALVGLAPDTVYRSLHVRTAERGFLSVGTWQGSREGGRYEIPVFAVLELDAQGAMTRADLYEPDQHEQALARFAALKGRDVGASAEPFANAASRYNDRFVRAWDARDWNAVREMHRPTCRVDDRRRMMRIEGPAEDGFRFFFDQPRSRWIVTPIATRGERLVLSRLVLECDVEAEGGAAAIDYLCVDEVDAEGLSTAMVVFDVDDEEAAYAELDARFAAGEGSILPPVVLGSPLDLCARDWQAWAAAHAPGFVYRDHRRLGFGSTVGDVDALVRLMRSTVELAPDARYRIDHVRISARGMLRQTALVGTRDGGSFESPMFLVGEVDEQGRIARQDSYDIEDLDRAFARFAEIAAPAASERPFENAASATAEPLIAAVVANDWARYAAVFSETLRGSDRRRLVQLDFDRDAHVAFARALAEGRRARGESKTLATRGERLALIRFTFVFEDADVGPSEIVFLLVTEVDASGRIAAYVRFDDDDVDAAYDELDARYDAAEAALHPRATAVRVAQRRPYYDRDWEAFAATHAPDLVCHDHRLLGWGTLRSADAFVRSQQALVELAPDTRVRNEHVAAAERGYLVSALITGTRDGGAFELAFLRVSEIDAAGRVCRIDLYDLGDAAAAHARFTELDARDATGLGPFENDASHAWRRVIDAWRARDVARFEALHPRALRYRDRRRLFQLDLDREGFLDFARPLLAMRSAGVSIDLLATRGERLALLRFTLTMEDETVGPSAIDSLLLIATDERREIAAYDRWDLEDQEAAWAELDARWAAGDGARYSGLWAMGKFVAALEYRDWDAAAACYAPDFVGHDHRLVSWGVAHGPSALMRTLQEMIALAPDARMRMNHQRARGRGAIHDVTWAGTHEGGAFESAFLTVTEHGVDGRIVHADFYDPHHLDRALARFEEIRASERRVPPAVSQRRNAATEALERIWSAFDAIEADAVAAALEAARAHFAPGFVWEDRRPIVGLTGDLDLMFASARERIDSGARHERRTIVDTAGDRVAVTRILWAGGPAGGRFEVEFLAVHELDAAGRCTALVFFEPDDARAAQREAWARWAAIDREVAPWVALLGAMTDGWNGRDRAALLARYADDVVVVDHRHTGIGRIEGAAAYVDANAVLWDLAPDQRVEFDSSELRFDRRALLVTLRRVGTLPDGGAFESPYVWVSRVVGGRITHLELFEIGAMAEAVACFEAMCASDRREARAASNAATDALDRWHAAFDAGDWDEILALGAPGMQIEDRRRLARIVYDPETAVADWRRVRAAGVRPERTRLGVAGERVAVERFLWTGGEPDGRFEVEFLWVCAVDESGRFTATIAFDPEDAREAQREAWARWAAIDPDVAHPLARLGELTDAWNARDRARLRACFAEGLVVEDHRLAGIGRIEGADAYADANAVLWELAPDQRIFFGWSVPAIDRHGCVAIVRREGTLPDGGAFESEYVTLTREDRDGLGTRVEFFELDALDAALARFDALRPDPLRIPPNAATRARDRWSRAVVARDWDAVRGLVAPDFVFEDRGRRALVRGDVESWIASAEYTTALPGVRIETPLVATAGDRLSLDEIRWAGSPEGDGFEFGRLRVLEVDAEGRFRAALLFDPDDRAAAHTELFERWIARGADGLPACVVDFTRAIAARDLVGVRAAIAEDFVYDDRRRTGSGRIEGADAYLASPRSWWELSEDARMDVLHHLAIAPRGFVSVNRMAGHNLDGGEFESLLVVLLWTRGELVSGVELFEIDQLDAALARFDALSAERSSRT